MQTKLTLSLEENLIQQVKVYAKLNGKSVSKIVAEFFTVLSEKSSDKVSLNSTPITEKLLGCMDDSTADVNDHKDYLFSKYQ